MGLVSCVDCDKRISDKAESCPNCGCPSWAIQKKFQHCSGCNSVLEPNAIKCANCNNTLVIRDPKTGGFREAYKWEKELHFKKKRQPESVAIANQEEVTSHKEKECSHQKSDSSLLRKESTVKTPKTNFSNAAPESKPQLSPKSGAKPPASRIENTDTSGSFRGLFVWAAAFIVVVSIGSVLGIISNKNSNRQVRIEQQKLSVKSEQVRREETKARTEMLAEYKRKREVARQTRKANQNNAAEGNDGESENLLIRENPYFVRYVSSTSLNERSSPDGPIVNKVYRGQLLQVYGSKGDWYRVTPKSSHPRYVHDDYLSATKPEPKPKSSDVFNDSRIESGALPTRAGQFGASAYDVETLWMGAREALDQGICSRIKDGDKSMQQSGKYYLNCGRSRNQFFSRSGNSIYFD